MNIFWGVVFVVRLVVLLPLLVLLAVWAMQEPEIEEEYPQERWRYE